MGNAVATTSAWGADMPGIAPRNRKTSRRVESSPIRRGARSPPAHGLRTSSSFDSMARSRAKSSSSFERRSCVRDRTKRFGVRSLLLQGASGLFEFSPAGWVDECRPPVPVRARVPVLARDRGRVRGWGSGRGGSGRGTGSAGPAELRAGARLPQAGRGRLAPSRGSSEGASGTTGFHRDLEQRQFNRRQCFRRFPGHYFRLRSTALGGSITFARSPYWDAK